MSISFPNRPVQESVAKAFCALGNYLDAKSNFLILMRLMKFEKKHLNFAMKNTNVVEALTKQEQRFSIAFRGQHRHARTQRMIRYYFAQDIHERAKFNTF